LSVINGKKLSEKIAEAFCEINIVQSSFIKKKLSAVVPENELQKTVINTMIENGKTAERDRVPLCQDTGIPVIFIETGESQCLPKEFEKLIGDAIDRKTFECGMRFSIADKTIAKGKRLSNKPVIHLMSGKTKTTKVVVMAKGGGSENLSTLIMMNPSSESSDIVKYVLDSIARVGAKGCPPYIIGIGLGGDSETCLIKAKMALTGRFGHNKSKYEKIISLGVFEGSKKLNIGVHGLGFGPTILDCRTIYTPSHIATLPLGIVFNCFQERVREFTL